MDDYSPPLGEVIKMVLSLIVILVLGLIAIGIAIATVVPMMGYVWWLLMPKEPKG